MRNLELWDVAVTNLEVNTQEKFWICTGHDDADTTKAIYSITSDLIVNSYDARTGKIRWTSDITEYATPNNKPVKVVSVSLQNFLCIALHNGELLALRNAGKICDPVGVFNSGLCAMEWSPDHEMVCLVTQEMNTCLLNCTFDQICEVNLWDQDFGSKQFITVGWGKKETQFHGSAGKQAAKMKDEYDLYKVDDKRVKVAWRGDGAMYAIGFQMDGIRRFKVFDKECRLMYTSEKQPGLESNISWRPSGNVIATTQKLPDKYTLTFFEKNGLKHGEFIVNVTPKTQIQNVLWSVDSDILTIQCLDTETNTQKILLYTTGNYHWYLKQTLEYKTDQIINSVFWNTDFDENKKKTLQVCLENGAYYTYTWIFNINHSVGTTVNDESVVVVIDEKKLLITNFRQVVVPPPMAAFEIPLETYVISVHFAPIHAEIDTNNFFICTSENKLVFYELTQKKPLQYKEQKTIQFEKYDYPFQFYNFQWVSADTIVCVTVDKDCCYILHEYTIDGNNLVKKYFAHIHDSITRIVRNPIESNKLFIQLKSAEMVEYKLCRGFEPIEPFCCYVCPKIDVVAVDNKLRYLALTYLGSLYIDGVYAVPCVTSFYIHTHFLLITTLRHVLLCIELNETGLTAIKDYVDTNEENDIVYKRKIERGATLVVVVPSDTRTVFQMPRGNLEAIQPRPLSLKIVGEYLDSLKYYEAFDLMRKQRINLNLIYDHDPEKFIANIDLFLEKITNNSWLNLFLSDLENSDVTRTMYATCYIGKSENTKRENNAKVENVCNMIREHLNKRSDSDSKILPLITTFVKKNTVEELEKALAIIKELKIKEMNSTKLPVGHDEALKYLLYMVDVNQLFDVALGMYDFDLVLLVANKSQKDPKEFIPMLNELNDMNENYKKFTINKHLKRFTRAVDCLVECGPSKHEELRTFVKYHSLYKEVLVKFTPDTEIYKQLSEDFGLYLKLKKQYIKAGIVYEKAKSYDKAVECYKDALEWEMALKLAQSWPEEKFKELCWNLVTDLKEERRHKEALLILEQFYGDFDKTITYALECGHYKTALRLCGLQNNDTVEKILPTLKTEFQDLINLIETNSENFTKYLERLQTVQNIKKETIKTEGKIDWDMLSDAASTIASSSKGSSRSSRSHRSSKNRRKQERKLASLKEGSQFEDIALIMHLHTIVTTCFDMRLQVKEMVTALIFFDLEEDALKLQNTLEALLNTMKDNFKTIWSPELTLEAAVVGLVGLAAKDTHAVKSINLIESHLRVPPVMFEMNWKVDGLE